VGLGTDYRGGGSSSMHAGASAEAESRIYTARLLA